MKRAITRTILLITLNLLTMTQTNAVVDSANKTDLGTSSYSGSACPKKSVSISINDTKDMISVTFKNYIAQSSGKSKKSLRKKCNILIPIQVKKGWSVSLIDTNYTGKLTLPTGAEASFTNVYSFAGQRGSRFHTNFKGPNDQPYNLHDPLSEFANVWSGCGSETHVRINSSLLLKPNTTASSTIDARQGFVTKLRYRKC
ncbi:MAG TPA: DUF4360 domain-containing protein [Thiothrix sp.]|nr:DUF4360 domain-containing protein [Thiothrix sp.]